MKYHPSLRTFVGQGNLLKQALGIITMDTWSILLRGHYGYGKTDLARILAASGTLHNEYTNKLFYYPSPSWEAAEVPYEDGVRYTVIVDECHLGKNYEWLYGPMEVNNYIFCSNMAAELAEPFISRCFTLRLTQYTEKELTEIVRLHAYKQGVELNPLVTAVIAQRSRGTPRTGIFFMRKYLAMYRPRYNKSTIREYFEVEGVDDSGLNRLDRKYLESLETGHKSKRTLQMILDISSKELDRMERYLIQCGLVVIETRGRRRI